jgi:hypothetical protein
VLFHTERLHAIVYRKKSLAGFPNLAFSTEAIETLIESQIASAPRDWH